MTDESGGAPGGSGPPEPGEEDGAGTGQDSTAGNDLPAAGKPRRAENANLDGAQAIDIDAAHDRSS